MMIKNSLAKTVSFENYDNYKQSGVEWLGDIPEHWVLKRFKHIFKEKKATSNLDLNCGSISFGKVVFKDDEKVPESTKRSYQVLNKGEFLINPLNLNYDLISLRIALSDKDVVVSSGYIIVQDIIELSKDYYKWLLHIFDVAFMKTLGAGVRQTLSFNLIANTEFVFPLLKEQTAIAQFLDDKTTKIDQAIAIKEQQINLLKERKQILIHKAVTQGLNPNVSLKDSGVEWIGEIPEHWEVKPLKYIGNSIIGLTYSPNDLCDEGNGTLVFRSSNLFQGKIKYGEKENVYVKSRISDKLMVKEDDILICSRNGSRDLIGKCALISNDDVGASFGAFTTVFRSEINPYIFCILNSSIFKALSGSFLTSTINQLTIGNLNSIYVPVPPKEEREKLKHYINNFSQKIETAIGLKQQEIEKLKEYKNSLINSCVTGKVKVF
ncbi:restriction endonuclease subunit S [Xanthomarina gelatinilytica]|uniref:restriction endonuclease subunit S n=1 Tax=Xanthomarina gelatinilytica TaxID=1137281 RepID=UPI003AA8F55B